MAIEPLETEFGRKRRINHRAATRISLASKVLPELRHRSWRTLRKPEATAPLSRYLPPVPEPVMPEIGERFSILVAGIGGSGVVTVSQTIAIAAYLDGLFSTNLDLTGLSQKWRRDRACAHRARRSALHATRSPRARPTR